jgi:cytidyltransferase-related domain
MENKKIILVTGGFDPIHSGHLAMFKEAKKLGDELWVGINSDEWLIRKKGFRYMSWDERSEVISMMSIVNKIISFNDDDNSSNNAISITKSLSNGNVMFANGGDRNKDTTMEYGIQTMMM